MKHERSVKNMDIINEYLKRTRNTVEIDGFTYERPRQWIECKDGFTVSVQAGRGMYCHPEISGADKYKSVELGYPSAEDKLILDYAEDPDEPTETIYPYVPVEIVVKLIEKHGGIVN
jgi:hypothetical protein